jgi:hypothetical protein
MRTWIIALAITAMAGSAQALGFCSAPTAPSSFARPKKPEKPDPPSCAGRFGGGSTCGEFEVSAYNRAVDSYNYQLRSYGREVDSYVDKLKDYLAKATAYAKCEVEALDD